MNKIKTLLFLCLFLTSFLRSHTLEAQGCNPDVLGPTATCNALFYADVLENEQLTITPLDIIEPGGVNDNCSAFDDLEFFITTDINLTNPPTTTTHTFPLNSSGTFPVVIFIVDEAGNFNICWGNVFINQLSADCSDDAIPPIFVCNPNVFVSSPLDLDFALTPDMLIQIGTDNCTQSDDINYFVTDDPNLTSPPTTDTIYFPAGINDTIDFYVWGVDEAGNFSSCSGQAFLFAGTPPCADDMVAPIAVCDAMTTMTSLGGNDFMLPAEILDDGSHDNCSAPSQLQFFASLDPSLTAPPTTDTLFFPAGTNDTLTVFMWVVDLSGNANVCAVEVILQSLHVIEGTVFVDDDQNCVFDSANENGIGGLSIRYTLDQGLSYSTINTFSNGSYFLAAPTDGSATEITIEVLLPNGISTGCITTQTLSLPLSNTNVQVDFPIQLSSDCDNLIVDVSSFVLRPCLPSYYKLSYCNLSSFDIPNAEITLTLPSDMSLQSAGFPFTDQGNNTFLFELGTVPSGTCGVIPLTMLLDCATPVGATRCVEAVISPSDCTDNLTWNGASLIVDGECDDLNNQVRFTITNQSNSSMISPQPASVVEDVVMYMTAPIQLGPGGSEVFEFPANGSTWRVEIPQESGHPSLSIPSSTIEGCGGYGTTGVVNQFSTPDVDPFISIDCEEVVASYDPNDKQAYPIGLTDEHFIEPNTSIEYKIRFQNTGNDTAFVVRLEDRLSNHLDWTSVQGGASSHPYRMELQDEGLLIFHFENILLPDSTTNLEASQGFVKFRVHQLPDNSIGTLIENTADIYFDFNDAVVTNTVFHTIGTNFIPTSTLNLSPDLDLTIAPNPFSDFTLFTLNGKNVEDGNFELFDITGRLVRQDNYSNHQYRLERNGLPSGAYLFRFKNKNGLLATGKLIVN